MKKTIVLMMACAVSGAAFADATTDIKANTPYSAYLQDSRGVIVRSNTGLCWRTNYWTPADAVPGCDGDLVPPVASVIAPPIVQAEPAKPAVVPQLAPVSHCDFNMTLQSEQTFAFNSSKLSPAAKELLNTQFRNKLATCEHIDKIVVTGYTDRIGSDSYNQALSESRANEVAEYLTKMNVGATIEHRGMGKQHELKECNGVKPQKKLIECLSPNRRVEIEVEGVAH